MTNHEETASGNLSNTRRRRLEGVKASCAVYGSCEQSILQSTLGTPVLWQLHSFFNTNCNNSFIYFILKDQSNYAKVVRVIIAGNSLSSCTRKKENESKVMNFSSNISLVLSKFHVNLLLNLRCVSTKLNWMILIFTI